MRLRACLLLTALVPASTLAEAPASRQFADALDVHVVNVDVVVQGAGGASVLGLMAADFEVTDDGEPVAVTYFAAPVSTPERVSGLRLVVFLDDAELDAGERRAAYDGLERAVDRLFELAGEVMLVRLSESLTVEKPFTTARGEIAGALHRLAGEAPSVDTEELREASLLTEIRRAAGYAPTSNSVINTLVRTRAENEGVTLLAQVRDFARERRERTLRTLAALSGLTSALSALEGRTAVLFVSGGLELRPGERLFDAWHDKFESFEEARPGGSMDLESVSYFVTTELDAFLDAARAGGVAFYTVASFHSRESTDRAPAARARPSAALRAGRSGDLGEQDALRLLAEATAGRFFPSQEAVGGAVDQLAADRAGLYSLGYPSPHAGDGELHAVAVRLRDADGEKVRLRYPASYRDRTPRQRLQERAAAALLLDVAENPLAVEIEVGARRPAADGTVAFAVELRVPMAKLLFVPEGDVHRGGLTAFIVTQGDGGLISSARELSAPLQIPNADLVAAMGQFGLLRTELTVRPGDRKVAIAVRDDVGDVDSALVFPLVADGEP